MKNKHLTLGFKAIGYGILVMGSLFLLPVIRIIFEFVKINPIVSIAFVLLALVIQRRVKIILAK